MTDSDDFMPAPEFGRSFKPGLGVNLLMRDVGEGVRFAREVLGATILHANEDFAAIKAVNMPTGIITAASATAAQPMLIWTRIFLERTR